MATRIDHTLAVAHGLAHEIGDTLLVETAIIHVVPLALGVTGLARIHVLGHIVGIRTLVIVAVVVIVEVVVEVDHIVMIVLVLGISI